MYSQNHNQRYSVNENKKQSNTKENKEEDIKNPTENSWINKDKIEPLKINWGEITPI